MAQDGQKSWWTTVPGLITAIATLITAVAGLIVALGNQGLLTSNRAADATTDLTSDSLQEASLVSPPASEDLEEIDHGTAHEDRAPLEDREETPPVAAASDEEAEPEAIERFVLVGKQLKHVRQGTHVSTGPANKNFANQYFVEMRDGGNSNTFRMRFALNRIEPDKFKLKRLDANDPPVVLSAVDRNTLKGGAYTLTFADD